jgi:hypothetical protein
MLEGVTGLLGILPPTIRGRAQASEISDRLPEALSSSEERESYVCSQGFSLLKGRIRQSIPAKIEHEVIPLFRRQKGFLDQLIIVPERGNIVYVYTFWENGEDAEKYERAPDLSWFDCLVVDPLRPPR